MDPKENGLKFYKNHLYSNVDVVSNILKLTFSFENCPSKLIFYEWKSIRPFCVAMGMMDARTIHKRLKQN